jgi:TPR repeat protein
MLMKKIILLIIYLLAIVLFSTGVNSIGKELTITEKLAQEDSLIEKYKRMAVEGDTSAMNRLGQSYSVGEGVPKDDTKAVEWFRKAAEAGNSDAMLNLGRSYYVGRGVPQDDTKAVEWFWKAAEAGNSDAMLGLGSLYALGDKVPRDDVKAIKLFKRAADEGNIYAKNLFTLGDLNYAITSRVDHVEALNQIRKKAKAGDEFAKKMLWRFGYSHSAWLDRLIAIATSLGISAILMIVVYKLPRSNNIL